MAPTPFHQPIKVRHGKARSLWRCRPYETAVQRSTCSAFKLCTNLGFELDRGGHAQRLRRLLHSPRGQGMLQVSLADRRLASLTEFGSNTCSLGAALLQSSSSLLVVSHDMAFDRLAFSTADAPDQKRASALLMRYQALIPPSGIGMLARLMRSVPIPD